MTLAILGGEPVISTPLRPYNSIGTDEVNAAIDAIRGGPLSGFLGGELEGGRWVRQLEELWCDKFNIKHAISMNSATSGLMAAALCITAKTYIGDNDYACCPSLTMSATASCFKGTGHGVKFADVDMDYFCMRHASPQEGDKTIIAVNLFGHPAELKSLRELCDTNKMFLIEDNAQSILAMEHNRYAGTVGHIGVFSLNVHKHINSGEGGVCVTDDPDLAHTLKLTRNHGELYSGSISRGYNFRMTEVTAAIACAQFRRVDELVAGRIEQAEAITKMVKDIPFIRPPLTRTGCRHVYYHWPFLFDDHKAGVHRDIFVKAMNAEGVPLQAGYVEPLYRLPALNSDQSIRCWTAEDLHYRTLGYFSNCQWNPTKQELTLIGDAFDKVASNIGKLKDLAPCPTS